MAQHPRLKTQLKARAPKGLALAAAIPLLAMAAVGTAAALALGGPRSHARLQRHIKRKQKFLHLKRTRQIPRKVKFKTWEKHEYKRPRT